jgi:hypothetical protein
MRQWVGARDGLERRTGEIYGRAVAILNGKLANEWPFSLAIGQKY